MDSVTRWRKSSFSMGNGNCVEYCDLGNGNVAIRHSTNRLSSPVTFTYAEWQAFTAGVKAGEFDLPGGDVDA